MQTYRALQRLSGLNYLQGQDRFISAREAPVFKLAVIGCGIMGTEHMYNTLLEGRGEIAGIYDPTPSSVEAAQRMLARWDAQPRVYPTLDAVLEDDTTDALLVASPNHTHIEVVRRIAGCDKAIFLEKPIATGVEDAMEIHRLLSAHPRYVQIGLQYRYKAPYREAIQETLVRRSLGRVHNVSLQEHRFPFLDKVGQWNKFNANTGGTLVEKCCHYFDLLNLFAQGTPQRVYASGHQAVNFRNFEREGQRADGLDHAQVVIDYDNQVTGHFSLNMFTAGNREELVINGEQARLQAVEFFRFGESTVNELEIWSHDEQASRRMTPSYAPHIAEAGHHGSTFFEHVAFADGLAGTHSLEYAPATLTDAVWSVVVASAAQASIARGEAVDISEFTPEGLPDLTGITTTENGTRE